MVGKTHYTGAADDAAGPGTQKAGEENGQDRGGPRRNGRLNTLYWSG